VTSYSIKKLTEDGAPAVVMTLLQQPHELELRKVRTSQPPHRGVARRHLVIDHHPDELDELHHEVHSAVHRAEIILAVTGHRFVRAKQMPEPAVVLLKADM